MIIAGIIPRKVYLLTYVGITNPKHLSTKNLPIGLNLVNILPKAYTLIPQNCVKNFLIIKYVRIQRSNQTSEKMWIAYNSFYGLWCDFIF